MQDKKTIRFFFCYQLDKNWRYTAKVEMSLQILLWF